MDLVGAGLGAAVADDGADADERGPGGLGLGGEDGLLDGDEVVAVVDHLDVPVVGLEALGDVLGVAELGGAVERDQVVVVEHDELAEAEGSGERAGLVRDAFHQVAVAAEDVGVVVDRGVVLVVVDGGEMLLRDGEADGLARPWPRGPVVTSTPGVSPYSGWPGVCEPHWRNCSSCEMGRS